MSERETLLYAEVNFICLLVVGIAVVKAAVGVDKRSNRRMFLVMSAFFEISFLMDYLWVLWQPVSHPVGTIVRMLRILCYLSGSFVWLCYAQIGMNTSVNRRLCALPLLISAALVLSNPWTELIFPDSGENGKLCWLVALTAGLYAFVPPIQALAYLIRGVRFDQRDGYRTVLFVPMVPAAFLAGQRMIGEDLPLLCVGISLALVLLFLNDQEELIAWDPLTRVNTRNQMMRYLALKMNMTMTDRSLYLLFVDADRFKEINDRYGHLAGDEALQRISDAMKKALPRSWIICRYGGDEFIVVGDAENYEEVQGHCAAIQRTLEQLNREAGAAYPLSVTIGIAERSEMITTIPEFIHEADADLYRQKEERKAAKQ